LFTQGKNGENSFKLPAAIKARQHGIPLKKPGDLKLQAKALEN
jgi:hypothetical protein